jgi:hypothetical protein
VNRGGSWDNPARNCRSANRNRNDPSNRTNNLGFRVARAPPKWQTPLPTDPTAHQSHVLSVGEPIEPPGTSSPRRTLRAVVCCCQRVPGRIKLRPLPRATAMIQILLSSGAERQGVGSFRRLLRGGGWNNPGAPGSFRESQQQPAHEPQHQQWVSGGGRAVGRRPRLFRPSPLPLSPPPLVSTQLALEPRKAGGTRKKTRENRVFPEFCTWARPGEQS